MSKIVGFFRRLNVLFERWFGPGHYDVHTKHHIHMMRGELNNLQSQIDAHRSWDFVNRGIDRHFPF